MTSLYPGLLFYSTGLNRKSTPVKPEATPSEIDRKLGRTPFNGRPWPRPSPVSNVYDVRNSSTRMIILNNKLSRQKAKASRLRGQTDNNGEITLPEPERHAPDVKPHTNWEHHKQCSLSVSEKFVPVFPPTVANRAPAWVNKTQRPAMKFDNGSGVNPNHHIQCQGHMDMDIIRWYKEHAHRRAGAGASRTSSRADGAATATSRALSPILNNPDLSRGEKRYLNHIAKIYSVDNMRQQKIVQYNTLMMREVGKGSYKNGEWEKYARYLATPRKTQFGPCDPFREKRSTSVPSGLGKGERGDSRPITSQTAQSRNTTDNSRKSVSTAPARSSNTKRQGVDRSRQSHQKQKTNDGKDVKRQPARHESPLPPPRERKDSESTISSLGDDQEDTKDKSDEPKSPERATDLSHSPKSEVQHERSGGDKQSSEDISTLSPRASGNIQVDEDDEGRKMDDDEDGDDERSKMSARDPAVTDEQRGASLEYRPTFGEREDEKDSGRVGDGKDKESPKTAPSGPEVYKYSSKQPEEVNKEDGGGPVPIVPLGYAESASDTKNESLKDEGDNVEPAPSSTKDSDHDEVVRLAKTPDSLSTQDAPQRDNEPIGIHHKEGKDRPLSRLGGREQFQVVQKDRDNSDDDYSDDEGDVDNNKLGDGGSRASDTKNSSNVPNSSDRGGENISSTQEKPSDISTIDY